MLKKFEESDIFYNQIKTYPECNFFIFNNQIYYNNRDAVSGAHSANVFPTVGKTNLYELNVDRKTSNYIYPFLTKDNSLTTFKTISTTSFNSNFSYGDTITSSYVLEAGLTIASHSGGISKANTTGSQIVALKNTLNYYQKVSPHYAYSSSFHGDKDLQSMTLIDVPSIFFGSSIKKGTIDIQYRVDGQLVAELKDKNRNGELVQMLPSGSNGSGSIAGIVLYNEGIFILTGSWLLGSTGNRWYNFSDIANSTSSLDLNFQGTQYIPTITMFCHAEKGEMNCSTNPTWIDYGQTLTPISSSKIYREPTNISVKNTIKSIWTDSTASFEKQIFFDKIGIFDKDKNLIAVAHLSSPKRKKESEELTVKLKIDMG